MHAADAFTQLRSLSAEQQRDVLIDPSAIVTERIAAAFLIAKRRDLATEERVRWLMDSWDSAPLELRRQILKALSYAPTPEGAGFIKDKLADPDLRPAALKALARTDDEGMLAVCGEVIRAGSECECRAAVSALMTIGTAEAIALVEDALRTAPSESCRQRAAYLLALDGVSSGEATLEKMLTDLQPLELGSRELKSGAPRYVQPDYLLTALALAQLGNKNGLVKLRELVDLVIDQNVDPQYIMGMTRGIVSLSSSSTVEEWKHAIQLWIDGKLSGKQ